MLDFGYYNLDCMEGMKQFPDQYFDLAVVDPPYGIGESGGKNHTRNHCAVAKDYKPFSGNDSKPPPPEYFAELFRVAKRHIIFGANHFIDNIPEPRNSPCWLVWDKDNGNVSFADCELAWTDMGGGGKEISLPMAGNVTGGHEKQRVQNPPDTEADCPL